MDHRSENVTETGNVEIIKSKVARTLQYDLPVKHQASSESSLSQKLPEHSNMIYQSKTKLLQKVH